MSFSISYPPTTSTLVRLSIKQHYFSDLAFQKIVHQNNHSPIKNKDKDKQNECPFFKQRDIIHEHVKKGVTIKTTLEG